MENLSELYYNVRIAKTQLEYLLEIARAILQPWPKRDSHGRVHTQSKQTAADDVTEPQSQALLLNDDDESSVKLLDEILAIAQTARDPPKKQRKVNTTKTLTPYMESSRSRTVVQRNTSKPAAKMGRAHSLNKGLGGAQSLEIPETSDQFSVEKHSNKITLPSKWSRLRAAIDKFADDKMEPMSKMEGQHFVQLLQQQGGSDHHVNSCLIIRATIEAVMDDVASIPMEQWTVNSRNTWQALYRVQHHLDLIQQLMVVLRKKMDNVSQSVLSSHCIKNRSPPRRLTYSSLKELLDYAESDTTLQLRLLHLRISQLCKSHFLPTICDASSTTSDTVMTTSIRNIYSLLGLKHSPIFVHMANNS